MFTLSKSSAVPPGTRQLVGRLCELGWLYRQLQQYVHSNGAAAGLVPQAFRHALQAELAEWFQLLAVLEAQRQSELSLLQLLVWSHQPTQRLMTMVQLVVSSRALKGGALTVALQRNERHGDPEVAGYVRHLLRQTCTPLFDMVRQWVLRGDLNDVHDEFFIQRKAVPLEALWREAYTLREAMLPCFITKNLARQVPRAHSLTCHVSTPQPHPLPGGRYFWSVRRSTSFASVAKTLSGVSSWRLREKGRAGQLPKGRPALRWWTVHEEPCHWAS